MTEGRLLIVEDDPKMQRLLLAQLKTRGYEVKLADSGEEALRVAAASPPNMALLDITLPGSMDGLELCRRLRAQSALPIILLTAADRPQTKITALELGADDYLTKPFHIGELIARIRAVLRRAEGPKPSTSAVIEIDNLCIDLERREARRGEEVVRLTKIEFDLLRELVTNADKALTYEHLLNTVWGSGYHDIRPVHVHICNLRRKLEPDPTGPRHILAVPGVGYRFRLETER